ncbi:hypothetical protein [Mucisphaera sp.]|uniref:hypothetical protein n=1 Tax=Mucisphaera sp. TaxID=2913024 RepID=UPI003D0960BF
MTFQQAWDQAALNHWYCATIGLQYVVAPLIGVAYVLVFRHRVVDARRLFLLIVMLALFALVWESTTQSIHVKWVLRHAASRSDEEKALVALRDTGNLAFAPFVAFMRGLAACGLLVLAALLTKWLLRPVRRGL